MTVPEPLPAPPLSPLESLEQIVAGASDLAALPQVVLRIIDVTNDSKVTPGDVEKIIGLDQALAAKILALANSSYYGMPQQISSLREAVVFLGVKTIRNLAMTLTTFNLCLGRADTPALARRALWRHSVDTALCARVIAGLLNPSAQQAVGADQAYTGGLLHDIGKMALDQSRHALFVSITRLSQTQHVRFHEIEEEALPFGHGQVGASLAARWNLPPALCEAIAFHHTPRAASLNPKLTATISLANEMTHCLQDAPEEGKDLARTHLIEACREAAIPLRVSDECLQGMARACRAELDKGLSGLAFKPLQRRLRALQEDASMITNNEDLLPLTDPAPAAPKPRDDDFGSFSSRVAETFDSVDLLLMARAEAEEAETQARAGGETPLPFLKDDKKNGDKPAAGNGQAPNQFGKFTLGGTASDDESPAAINLLGDTLMALSDASTVQTSLSTKDFLSGELATADFHETAARTVVGGETRELADVHIDELLNLTVQSGASDLHLSVGLPPMVRKDGRLVPLPFEKMQERDTQRIVFDVLNNGQIEKFERTRELDFSYGVKGVGRFRFNVYRQRSSVGCAMRVIPNVVPSMEQLKLPPVLRTFTQKHSGLILVTGPTGSGKSTTIASMIDIINTEREAHILTIEDPIEYLHSHKKSMVNQRELGTDTDNFTNALRASLREDPDVILVGEMRDLETIAAAITLAETGHLVFATLHTRSAPATIDRIVDVFPAHQQEQVRVQLSTSIEAVVSQQLLPRIGGGRVSAIEIMVATSALRNLIREGKSYQIYSVIETGQQYGMQAMDRVLADLNRSGQVTFEEAATRAIDRENFNRLVKGY